MDIFSAKVDNSGNLLWNTFLGGSGNDFLDSPFLQGSSISADSSGNLYMIGTSDASWGLPSRVYTSGNDSVVVKLDNNGNLLWNTFLGSSGHDRGLSIFVSNNENIYVGGASNVTWGTPVRPYSSGYDAFLAKLSEDTTPPTITLTGTNPITVSYGSTYTDAGATATDNIDGDLTSSITVSNPVNTGIAGTYTVTHDVADAAGNNATQVTRTVTVRHPDGGGIISGPLSVGYVRTYPETPKTNNTNEDSKKIEVLTEVLNKLTEQLKDKPSLPVITRNFTRNLTLNSEGDDVLSLQQLLNSDPDTEIDTQGPGSKGNETKFFGRKTRDALIKFQKKHNINPALGFFGPLTREKVGEMGR